MNVIKRSKLQIALFALVGVMLVGCTQQGGAVAVPTPEPTPTQAPAPEPTPTEAAAPVETPAGNVLERDAHVESVELRMLESFPVQVHAAVKGTLPDPCWKLGKESQTRNGNTIEVRLQATRPAEAMCMQAIHEFEQTIPVDVAGLPAGTYTVTVNGVSETFTLQSDNK